MNAKRELHAKRLREALDQLRSFDAKGINAWDAQFKSWQERTTQSIGVLFGKEHDYYQRFNRLTFWETRNSFGGGHVWRPGDQRTFDADKTEARQLLTDALEELEAVPPDEQMPARTARELPAPSADGSEGRPMKILTVLSMIVVILVGLVGIPVGFHKIDACHVINHSDTEGPPQSATNFTEIVVAAQNDDRKAFDQLRAWADDESHPFSAQADAAWNKIVDDYEIYFLHCRGLTLHWDEGTDPSQLTLEELTGRYNDSPISSRPAILEYISRRDDIGLNAKMEFLLEVMKATSSMKVLACAADYFDQRAQLPYKNILVDPYVDWWEDNRHTIQ